MPWPRPEFVLYVLGVFFVGYGFSITFRAIRGRRWREHRETCPECRRPWKTDDGACSSCGAASPPLHAIRAARWWIGCGVGIAVTGALAFLGGVGVADWIDDLNAHSGNRPLHRLGPYLGAGMGLSLFGVYVLILGYRGQASKGRRRCPKCWYLIDEACGLKCSECGHEAGRERDLFRPRRRLRLATLGLVLISTGQLGWLESRVRRGGWVAAVPTEVLVIGMPWLPDMCLRGGVMGADQDWSLHGRIENQNHHRRTGGPRMWRWQEDWARERAASWVCDTRTTMQGLRAVDLLARIDYRPWTRPRKEAHAALLHSLNLSIDHLNDPKDICAGALAIEAAKQVWLPAAQGEFLGPTPEVSELVTRRTDELLSAARSGPAQSRGAAALLLGLGDGRPEVVEALADLAASEQHAATALSWLAARHPAVASRLAEILGDPTDTRRAAVSRSARRMLASGEAAAIELSLHAMLASQDHTDAFRAAEVLMLTRSDSNKLAVLDRVIEIVRADPSQIVEAENLFGYEPMHQAVNARAPVILEIARSETPELRRLALVILLAQNGLEPELNRAAVELLDAGVAPPPWARQWDVRDLRSRFMGSR